MRDSRRITWHIQYISKCVLQHEDKILGNQTDYDIILVISRLTMNRDIITLLDFQRYQHYDRFLVHGITIGINGICFWRKIGPLLLIIIWDTFQILGCLLWYQLEQCQQVTNILHYSFIKCSSLLGFRFVRCCQFIGEEAAKQPTWYHMSFHMQDYLTHLIAIIPSWS